MKKLALLLAFIMSAISIVNANTLSAEMMDKMQAFSDLAEERFETLDQLAEKNNASTYSIAKISIGYGSLNVGAGSGRVSVSTDSAGKLTKISVKADVGMLGIESTISESITISDLKSGKTLSFSMDGSSGAVMKIIPQSGFSDFGGKAQIKINTKEGWKTENVEILRGKTSGKYFVWQGNNTIDQITVNMRGYSISAMKVGWYELE